MVKELLKIQQQNKMPGVQFCADFAAQLILLTDEFAFIPQDKRHPESKQRRIEICLTRLGGVRKVK